MSCITNFFINIKLSELEDLRLLNASIQQHPKLFIPKVMQKYMRNSTKIITLLIILLIVGALVVYLINRTITGQVVEDDSYLYTQAICNDTEHGVYCEDYEISCRGNELSGVRATGASVYHDENWQDPRGENGSEVVCR